MTIGNVSLTILLMVWESNSSVSRKCSMTRDNSWAIVELCSAESPLLVQTR